MADDGNRPATRCLRHPYFHEMRERQSTISCSSFTRPILFLRLTKGQVSSGKRAGFAFRKGRFYLPKPALLPLVGHESPNRNCPNAGHACLHLHYETHKKRSRIGRPSWQQETEPLGAIRLPEVRNGSSARPQSCPSRREGRRHRHHKSTSRS